MKGKEDNINWEKINNVDNDSMESLSYEEIQAIKEYEHRKFEEAMFRDEFPNKDITIYK